MGEDHGLIAVEIVDDPIVIGLFQQRYAHHAVVANAAHHDPGFGGDGADGLDVFAHQGIPGIADLPEHHLVQRLKGHLVGVVLEFCGDALPQLQKPFLQRLVIEEPAPVHVLFQRVEGVAVAFVQVDEHVQLVGLAPAEAVSQIVEAGFQCVARFILQHVVVHRHPDVVKAQACDVGNVLFCDKRAEVIMVILGKLGNPAAQIDALLESCKASHIVSSLFVCGYRLISTGWAVGRTHALEILQQVGKPPGIVQVDLVTGIWNEVKLAARDTLGKTQGGFFVGLVVFAAEYQGRAADAAQTGGEVYLAGGFAQADKILLAVSQGLKAFVLHKAEHQILKGQQKLWTAVLSPDEHKRMELFRVIGSILQRQHPAQGQTAEAKCSGDLAAIFFQSGVEILEAGLFAPKQLGKLRAAAVTILGQKGNGFFPAGTGLPQAMEKDIDHNGNILSCCMNCRTF